jgi:hypothetical protein
MQGLQLTEVLLGHRVILVGLGDRTITHKHGERCCSVVPQKEPHFSQLVHGPGHGEVKIGIDAMPRLDMEIHTMQNCRFRARAPQEPDSNEVVSHVEVGGQSPRRPRTKSQRP